MFNSPQMLCASSHALLQEKLMNKTHNNTTIFSNGYPLCVSNIIRKILQTIKKLVIHAHSKLQMGV
jgi:hypothetical protein